MGMRVTGQGKCSNIKKKGAKANEKGMVSLIRYGTKANVQI